MSMKIDRNFSMDNDSAVSNDNRKWTKFKSVDARALNLNVPADPIEAKRKNVRKQAMKLITDAWGRDEKASKGIDDMRNEKRSKIDELDELKSKSSSLEDSKRFLKEEYGVADDSQEQKDLELLEKYQNNKIGSSFDSFSEEEKARLKELQNTPLTEYQRKALEINDAKAKLDKEVNRKNDELKGMTQAITDAKIEQLKSQDMLKAQNAADTILDAVNKDIINMLVDESKKHIDEVQKKEQEESETDVKKQSVDHIAKAQEEISKMLKDKNLINEDLLGIEIDLNF